MSARYAKSVFVGIVGMLWIGAQACGGLPPGTSIFDAGQGGDTTTVPGDDSSLNVPSDGSSSFVIPTTDDSSAPPDAVTQTGSCEGGACADSMPAICGDSVIPASNATTATRRLATAARAFARLSLASPVRRPESRACRR
jgi:hypothetical protein